MGALHIHIGPGSLGLGLVLALANEVKFDSHLVTRRDSETPCYEEYELAVTGREPEPLEFKSYSKAERHEELCDTVKESIGAADGAPLLVTTAVGGELTHCVELIVEIAEQRAATGAAEVVFIACENSLGDCYEELVKRLRERGVDCRLTMVNRLCPKTEPNAEKTVLSAYADPYLEWVIQGEQNRAVLALLGKAAGVSFAPDVEPYCVRKRWLVNGGHLALALFARFMDEPSIKAVAREVDRQAQVLELHADMIAVFPAEWESVLGDSKAYGQEQIVPWCRTEDDTTRILKRLKRTNLKPFLEDADRKLGDPARRYRTEVGRESPELGEVFKVLHKVLLTPNAYEDDWRHDNARALDERSDDEALDAYERLLTGTVSQPTRDERVADLRRSFRSQRQLSEAQGPFPHP